MKRSKEIPTELTQSSQQVRIVGDQVTYFPHCHGEYTSDEKEDCHTDPKCQYLDTCILQSIKVIVERALEWKGESVFKTTNKRTEALREIKEILGEDGK